MIVVKTVQHLETGARQNADIPDHFIVLASRQMIEGWKTWNRLKE
jgi:hypothetical protein